MEEVTQQYDLIVLGGGPTGLAAAIYGGRARLNTLVLEKGNTGGRAHTTREIVNYPGTLSTGGPELSEAMEAHAKQFGAEIRREQVKSVDLTGDIKIVQTRRHTYEAKAVIIATGTTARVLNIPGEKELTGMGVAYCATCDAEFFKDQTVIVVGSGDQGIEEGMYIARFAKKVIVIVLHDEGILDCNKQSAEKALKHPKMEFVWNSVLNKIEGESEVTGVKVENVKTGEITDIPCEGVFFFVGTVPVTDIFKGQVDIDSRGWIPTTEKMETNLPGVYAAGDVRDKYLRQVCTGVSDGAIAATAAERYIEELNDFQTEIVESDKPVLLAIWDPTRQAGLDILSKYSAENAKMNMPYKVVEIDVTRKQGTASRFGVSLSDEEPIAILKLDSGKLCGKLDLNLSLSEQKWG